MLDRRADRARRARRARLGSQVGMAGLELPDLSVRTPLRVKIACVAQIGVRDFLEASGPVKSRGELVRECLVVNKAVRMSRTDRAFVEVLGVDFTAGQTRDFCARKHGAIREILRTFFGPDFELPMMTGQRRHMRRVPIGGYRVARRGMRQRAIEVVFGNLQNSQRYSQQTVCSRRGVNRSLTVAGKESGLALADPIPAFNERKSRMQRKAPFDFGLAELPVVEAAELGCKASQHPYEGKLRADEVRSGSELHLLHESKRVFGFALDVRQRIAGKDEIGVELQTANTGVNEVSGSRVFVERPSDQVLPGS